jgi:hypothetical protein
MGKIIDSLATSKLLLLMKELNLFKNPADTKNVLNYSESVIVSDILKENKLDFILKDQVKAYNLLCCDLDSTIPQGDIYPFDKSSEDHIIVNLLENSSSNSTLKSDFLCNGLYNKFGSIESRNVAVRLVQILKDHDFRATPEGSVIYAEFVNLRMQTSESYLTLHRSFNISEEIIGNVFLYSILGVDLSVDNIANLSNSLQSIYRCVESIPVCVKSIDYESIQANLSVDQQIIEASKIEALKDIDLVQENNKSNFGKIVSFGYSSLAGIHNNIGTFNLYAQYGLYGVMGCCGLGFTAGFTYYVVPFVLKQSINLIKENSSNPVFSISELVVPVHSGIPTLDKLSYNDIIYKFMRDILNKIFDKS